CLRVFHVASNASSLDMPLARKSLYLLKSSLHSSSISYSRFLTVSLSGTAHIRDLFFKLIEFLKKKLVIVLKLIMLVSHDESDANHQGNHTECAFWWIYYI